MPSRFYKLKYQMNERKKEKNADYDGGDCDPVLPSVMIPENTRPKPHVGT